MNAARWPRGDLRAERMMVLDPRRGSLACARLTALPDHLRAGDLVVVNDAGTIPASLRGETAAGDAIELRLAGAPGDDGLFPAVLFDDGDWRTPTERRSPPPAVRVGDALAFDGLRATVRAVDTRSPRLLAVRFDAEGVALWAALHRAGRPVQYAYAAGPLPLWAVHTPFAGRPFAVEMPSAGRALRWEILNALRRKGVRVASVTHAAGLSSTGDPVIDAMLPLPERSIVPPETARAVAVARAEGTRVLAVGTSVVRALESAADADGVVRAGERLADLRVEGSARPRVVDALLTGVHERGTSHHALMTAFAPAEALDRAIDLAAAQGYLLHEFGDSVLIA